MNHLTKADIVAAKDLETREVACPEWGGVVLIRTLTVAQVQKWRRALFMQITLHDKDGAECGFAQEVDPEKASRSDARLVASSIIDENGALMFTDAEIETLMGKSAAPIKRIAKAQAELSGITDAPEVAVEKAEKNSKPNPAESLNSN